jgi:hypothetical protein
MRWIKARQAEIIAKAGGDQSIPRASGNASYAELGLEPVFLARGPGRIERAIEGAFNREPSRFFTVKDLTPMAYPGLSRPAKRHRVAILRAADRVADRVCNAFSRPETTILALPSGEAT